MISSSSTAKIGISVVIPVYNEVENVKPLFDEVVGICRREGYDFEVIFVDDGSSDGTYGVLKQLAPATVIRLRRNFGQTAGFDAGFRAASKEFVVTMDGDGQNDPADIPRLLKKLQDEDLDVVSGWRKDRQDPLSKRIISRGANLLRKLLLNDNIQDSGCSLKIYRRSCLEGVRLYGEMHRFIPAMLQIKGYIVGEVAVNHRARTAGRSKYNFFRTVKGAVDMLQLWFWRSYAVRPLHLFGAISLIFFAFSGIFGLRTIYLYAIGQKLSSTLEPLLTVFTFISGLLLLILGVLADIIGKIYYETSGENYYTVREKLVNPEQDSPSK